MSNHYSTTQPFIQNTEFNNLNQVHSHSHTQIDNNIPIHHYQQHNHHLSLPQQQNYIQQNHHQDLPNSTKTYSANQFYAQQNQLQQIQMVQQQIAKQKQEQEEEELKQRKLLLKQQQQSHKKSVSTSTITSTPKKKRGRPPKLNSFTERITTQVNININTSPLNSSPAESNSNQAAKQGAPNIFTPLMRVSPTNKSSSIAKRKRKNSSSSTISNTSPILIKKSKSFSHPSTILATPLSSTSQNFPPNSLDSNGNSYQFSKKTFDNISLITQHHNQNHNNQGFYNTPPSSSAINKSSYFTPHQNGGDISINQNTIDIESIKKNHNQNNGEIESPIKRGKSISDENKNLLPPVSLNSYNNKQVAEKKENTEESKPQISRSNSFSLKLTIDDSGKAVLSSDIFQPTTTTTATTTTTKEVKEEPKESEQTPQPAKAQLTTTTTPKQPQLNRSTSDYQLEDKRPNILRRHNSDITNIISQPKLESTILSSINENYLSTNYPTTPQQSQHQNISYLSTGLTPMFNLTPQFNSLMYSVMNLNSPQFKKGMNPFTLNQEIFTSESSSQSQPSFQPLQEIEETVDSQQSNLQINESHAEISSQDIFIEPSSQQQKLVLGSGGDNSQPQGNGSCSDSSLNSEDSGDARLALKKMIQIRD
ncbi:hypothetical protein KGF54_003190 [Candida jiufengensis]|uniref:uncharacterized protein n=1 Tax=Candida jiufengensis TaxID=497108 RepID=UPI0022253B48|nr:uncharacterized protein KGF54_003190 [Candida jiufengensis]KAI5952324.1 hypothetical protein KGF54_003190 [Candida jiufengensis]